jgi:hypothetical protein
MAITTTWRFRYGNLTTPLTDITSFVMNGSVDQKCGFPEMARGHAQIVINNKTGAFTPLGGGTYGTVDWFNMALSIDVNVTSSAGSTGYVKVFDGILQSFSLEDNGVMSYVTIDAVDALSVGGRNTPDFGPFDGSTANLVTRWYANGNPSLPPNMPTLGAAVNGYSVTAVPLGTNYNYSTSGTSLFQSLAEGMNNGRMAGMFTVAIPTSIDVTIVDYQFQFLDFTLTKTGAYRKVYEFIEQTPTGTKLPIGQINEGYREELLTNSVKMGGNGNSATYVSVQNFDSIKKYGPRYRQYLNASQVTSSGTDQSLTAIAQNWVNRFGDVNFMPYNFSLSSKQVQALCDEAARDQWSNLLSIVYGLWQTATVTYTPTGCSQRTRVVVIAGRTITFDPNQTFINIDLLPGHDYQSFLLNSNEIGLLNSDRLG